MNSGRGSRGSGEVVVNVLVVEKSGSDRGQVVVNVVVVGVIVNSGNGSGSYSSSSSNSTSGTFVCFYLLS